MHTLENTTYMSENYSNNVFIVTSYLSIICLLRGYHGTTFFDNIYFIDKYCEERNINGNHVVVYNFK